MTNPNLRFKAGPGAITVLREQGFRPEQVRTIAGASGGPKWLVLNGLDRAILTELVPSFREPVNLIGSSIGAWRFSCYGQSDPLAALDRFERAYLNQQYSEKPDRHEISKVSREVLDSVLGSDGVAEVLAHPIFRTHIMTVRSRGILNSERTALLAASLAAAATANLIRRQFLGGFFVRSLYYDRRASSSFRRPSGFPIDEVPLSAANLKDAVVASGSIPLLLNGVRDIAGAPPGTYRDGGVIDYHLDLPLSDPEGLTLYPHFYGHITPGWFDKKLSWRKPRPENFDRVLLVSPTEEFVDRLPGGKIPDRSDFMRLERGERERAWTRVVAESQRLGDEFLEAISDRNFADRVVPLD